MIEPTTVWMVHLDRGAADETEGTLSADDWGLVFVNAASPETTRFPFVDIVSVKRVLGSPVFVLRWRRDEGRRETAFYLSRPPPLGILGGQDRPGAALQTAASTYRGGKWRQRRENTRYLATTAASLKDRRDSLVGQIRTAMKRARSETS